MRPDMNLVEQLIFMLYGYDAVLEYREAKDKQSVIDKLLDSTYVVRSGRSVHPAAVYLGRDAVLKHSQRTTDTE